MCFVLFATNLYADTLSKSEVIKVAELFVLQNGYTALHIAAKKNDIDIAQMLLDYHADPSALSAVSLTTSLPRLILVSKWPKVRA